MKIIQSKNYKEAQSSSKVNQVKSLVQRGISVETAIEQIFGVRGLGQREIERVKREVSRDPSKRSIKSI